MNIELTRFLITLIVGLAGAYLALKLKIPAGGILGSLFAVVAFNLISGGQAFFYPRVKQIVQLLVGVFAGAKIGKTELKELKKVPQPLVAIIGITLLYNILFGLLIGFVTNTDQLTALYITAPGGLSDMALIAETAGVNNTSMTMVQLLRVILFNVIFPPVFCAIAKKVSVNYGKTESKSHKLPIVDPVQSRNKMQNGLLFAGLLASASLGGFLISQTGIEGGLILGAMLFSMFYSCLFGKTNIAPGLKKCHHALLGAYIGSGIVLTGFSSIQEFFVPLVFVAIELCLATATAAFLAWKTKKLDTMSSMTASTPGGLAEMLALTDELGGDVSKVVVIHSMRLIVVVAVCPTLFRWIVSLIC